jgi:hypothetical protein
MHIYELDGVCYPSVTTILKLISIDDRLLNWANYMGFKRKNIKDIQNDTAEFGTGVHSHIRYIVDREAPIPEPFLDMRREYELSIIKRRFIDYFKDIKYRTINTEIALISKSLKYGGTLDWLVQIENDGNDNLFLLDFKTSKAINEKMYLQLGGYYNLLKEININVDYAGIIIINERECSLHPIAKETLIKYGEAFLSLVSFYNIWEGINKIKPNYDVIKLVKKTT